MQFAAGRSLVSMKIPAMPEARCLASTKPYCHDLSEALGKGCFPIIE